MTYPWADCDMDGLPIAGAPPNQASNRHEHGGGQPQQPYSRPHHVNGLQTQTSDQHQGQRSAFLHSANADTGVRNDLIDKIANHRFDGLLESLQFHYAGAAWSDQVSRSNDADRLVCLKLAHFYDPLVAAPNGCLYQH